MSTRFAYVSETEYKDAKTCVIKTIMFFWSFSVLDAKFSWD